MSVAFIEARLTASLDFAALKVSVLETKSVRPARPKIIRDHRTVRSIQEKMRHANQENNNLILRVC
jgi:hypothetical protein